MLFSGYKKLFLTFSEKGASPIVLLFLTFWKVKNGKGGVQRSATRRTNNKKAQTIGKSAQTKQQEPHKQKQVAQTIKSTKQQQ